MHRTTTCQTADLGPWQGARNITDILHWQEGQHSRIVGLPQVPANPPQQSPKTKVLVYVHGFTMRYPMAVENVKRLEQVFQCTVVGFIWPGTFKGRSKTGKIVRYIHSKSLAETSADRLRQLLQVLIGHGNEVNIVGHSMGVRVVLKALLGWEERRIKHVFLWAAAVPATSFNETDQFAMRNLAGTHFTVFHSKNDDVLPYGYKIAEFVPGLAQTTRSAGDHITALGQYGPKDLEPQFMERVTSVDVSEEVACHHTGSWMASPTVQATMCELMDLPAFDRSSNLTAMTALDIQEHENLVAELASLPDQIEDEADLHEASLDIEDSICLD